MADFIPVEDFPDLVLLNRRIFADDRGAFSELFRDTLWTDAGIEAAFVQDNHSHSRRGVLRGLHYQLDHPQGKLISVVSGAIYDVAVDIRQGSPTFLNWTSVELSAENGGQLFIPEGFAHGFCVLSDAADIVYKCTDYYHGEDDRGVRWSDPDIGVDWPVKAPLVSDRDAALRSLADIPSDELPVFVGGAEGGAAAPEVQG